MNSRDIDTLIEYSLNVSGGENQYKNLYPPKDVCCADILTTSEPLQRAFWIICDWIWSLEMFAMSNIALRFLIFVIDCMFNWKSEKKHLIWIQQEMS